MPFFNKLKPKVFWGVLLFSQIALSTEAVRVGVLSPPSIRHPAGVKFEDLNFTEGLLFKYLVEPDTHTNWTCYICDSLPSIEDIREQFIASQKAKSSFIIKLKIRKDILWSDGSPLTLGDILFSWKVYKRFALQSSEPDPTFIIEDISLSSGENEISIKLKDFRIDIFQYLQIPIIRDSLEESIWFRSMDEGLNHYLHASHYSVEPQKAGLFLDKNLVKNVSKQKIELSVAHKNIEIHYCEKISECLLLIEQNKLDVIADYDPQEDYNHYHEAKNIFTKILGSKHIFLSTHFIPRMTLVHLNAKNPRFLDQDLKNTLYTSIVNTRILDDLTPNTRIKPTRLIFKRDGLMFINPPLTAKNTPSRKREVEITTLKNRVFNEDLLNKLKTQLATHSIVLTTKNLKETEFHKEIITQGNYPDLLLMTWDLPFDTVPFNLLHSDEIPIKNDHSEGQNLSNYANVELDKWLNDLLRMERIEDIRTWEGKIFEHVSDAKFIIPLFYHYLHNIFSKDVMGEIIVSDGVQTLSKDKNFLNSISNHKKSAH